MFSKIDGLSTISDSFRLFTLFFFFLPIGFSFSLSPILGNRRGEHFASLLSVMHARGGELLGDTDVGDLRGRVAILKGERLL